MFSGATSLTTLNLTDWGVNRTVSATMTYMFSDTTVLTNLTLTNFKTTNVTNMSWMFYSSGVTSLDLSSWDVSKVTTFGDMFYNAKSLTTLNLTDWGSQSNCRHRGNVQNVWWDDRINQSNADEF
ncbi:BspA family leucine-rich repeat surface protein [Leuconostoc falkenbergense]|uniref:BspA family leucine-rich repeat surface protein n=1 Tax=Leuconostoc falkenbergense TaxID=2766470 RepID=UPI001FC8166C|nr:BspA family leucine-rich repeat surface protein [Leuconostoc falkenbergense]